MAIKGSIIKEELIETILATIPNSFRNEKEVRVDGEENGVPIQIKIALTAVKKPLLKDSKSEVINEGQFEITDKDREDMTETLKEMGVEF